MSEETSPDSGSGPDPALTIKPNRLAGSDHCLNCGTELEGPFCHYCGQPDKRFQRVLPENLESVRPINSPPKEVPIQ